MVILPMISNNSKYFLIEFYSSQFSQFQDYLHIPVFNSVLIQNNFFNSL